MDVWSPMHLTWPQTLVQVHVPSGEGLHQVHGLVLAGQYGTGRAPGRVRRRFQQACTITRTRKAGMAASQITAPPPP
jgi:hypothetical protein